MTERAALRRYGWLTATPTLVVSTAVIVLSMAVHLWLDAEKHPAPWTNNDTALIVYMAQQMDAGARLYLDWRDPSMPSIFFVALSAVRLGRIAGVPALVAYDWIVAVVALAGASVLVRALHHMKRPGSAVVLTLGGYLFFVARAGSNVPDFGQREHLFALLLIPELFAVAAGYRWRWRPLWCAVLTFTAMMKPQFAAAVILLEIAVSPRARPRTIDVVGLLAGAVAPFLMLWWHSADSVRAFFVGVLRLHLSGAYAELNRSPTALLARWPVEAFGAAAFALGAVVFIARRDRTLRGLAVRGSVALGWGAAAVLSQQKYFPYHFTPLFGFAIVLAAWVAGEWLATQQQQLLAGSLAAGLVALSSFAFHRSVAINSDPLAVRLEREVGPDATLLVVSVYAHGLCTPYSGAPRCIGPDSQMTTLPKMARSQDAERELAGWASAVREQIRQERPDVLAISTSDNAMPDGLTPARLLLERFPAVTPGQYVELDPASAARVDARGWIVLERRDVRERTRSR